MFVADKASKLAARGPARRVTYRSSATQVVRLTLGGVLAAVMLILIVPVLAADRGPPAGVALFIGTNLPGPPPLAGQLALDIVAQGCKNPAYVEGEFVISDSAWEQYAHAGYPDKIKGPTQAELIISGAEVTHRSIAVGLGGGAFASPISGRRIGFFGDVIFDGTGTYRLKGSHRSIAVHNDFSPRFGDKRNTAVVLTAPQWPRVRASLHFLLRADLVRSAGYHSCYLELPQLFTTFPVNYVASNDAAFRDALHFASAPPPQHPAALFPLGLPDQSTVTAGIVNANVTGTSVAGSTIGSGGTATPHGVEYVCQATQNHRPSVIPFPTVGRITEPNCSGAPRFDAVGVNADITRRTFFAGIFGALAATVIIETLFFGSTDEEHPGLIGAMAAKISSRVEEEKKAGWHGLFG